MFQSKRLIFAAAQLCTLLISAGCATLFSRGYDDLTIESNPPGAEVYWGAEKIGTTPFTRRFDRDTFEIPKLTFRKAGYLTQTVTLQRTLERTALFNFGFFLTTCGGTSWGIDAVSGNMIRYTPDSYLIDLQKADDVGSATWQQRHLALAYLLTNQANLLSDIARGGGDYLEAYYFLHATPATLAAYPAFLQAVRQSAPRLLACETGLELDQALLFLASDNRPG